MKLKSLLLIGLFFIQISSASAWYSPWQHSKNREYQKYLAEEVSKDLFTPDERYYENEREDFVNEEGVSIGWIVKKDGPEWRDEVFIDYRIANKGYRPSKKYYSTKEKFNDVKKIVLRLNHLSEYHKNKPSFKIISDKPNDLIYEWNLVYDEGVNVVENNVIKPQKYIVEGTEFAGNNIPVQGFGRIVQFDDKIYHVYRRLAFKTLNREEREKFINRLRNISVFNGLLNTYAN